MNKFDIIRGALNKLSVPFDESNYYSNTIYAIADKEFDNIMYTAFTSTRISTNVVVASLNKSVDDPVDFNGETYYPYMLPEDFLFLVEKPVENIFFGRNRVYTTAGSTGFTIKYCKTNDISKISPTVRKYLEYYLASELAPAINRHSAQGDLFQRAMYHLNVLQEGEAYDNVDVIGGLGIRLY